MAINLLDWRSAQLRRQKWRFIGLSAVALLIAVGANLALQGYQQHLQRELAQQRQQQTALRQTNQGLQQQIPDLQAQINGQFGHESAVIHHSQLNVFLDLLSALPLQNGRLTLASLTTDNAQTQLSLQGYSVSAQQVEQLKTHLAQTLPSAQLELSQFELQPNSPATTGERFQFAFQIQLAPPAQAKGGNK